jgi:hypothetical protein
MSRPTVPEDIEKLNAALHLSMKQKHTHWRNVKAKFVHFCLDIFVWTFNVRFYSFSVFPRLITVVTVVGSSSKTLRRRTICPFFRQLQIRKQFQSCPSWAWNTSGQANLKQISCLYMRRPCARHDKVVCCISKHVAVYQLYLDPSLATLNLSAWLSETEFVKWISSFWPYIYLPANYCFFRRSGTIKAGLQKICSIGLL